MEQLWIQMLISTGFLMASSTILAAILIWAEKKILNYGPCIIDINNGEKKFEVLGGSSLLSLLAQQGIFIPSACGGRGSCAYCKVTVKEGGGMIGPVEEPYLSPGEKSSNVRLSCQVKVRSNIFIEIPKEYFSVKRFLGKVVSKKTLTHDIVELRIQLKQPGTISYVAGQYMQIESPEYKGRESVMRAYSLSSVPSDPNHVEFIIRKVPNGICTTWVFEHLKEGQEINLSGPYGDFGLRDTDSPILFIAGGSGMAPIWSMARYMKEQGIKREAIYFFGAQSQRDLFFREEMAQLEKEMPNFKFIPALSNEPPDTDWKGQTGLITDVVARNVPDTSKHEAYLCGSPGMIDACIKVLKAGGIPEDKVYFDKFS